MSPHRDRTGDVVDPDAPDHHCTRGWLGDPDADHPRPCPTCRPWAAQQRRPRSGELEAFRRRHPTETRNP